MDNEANVVGARPGDAERPRESGVVAPIDIAEQHSELFDYSGAPDRRYSSRVNSREDRMPFDGTPIIHPAKSPGSTQPNRAEVGFCQFTPSSRPGPMPLRHLSRASERVGNTLAVLAFARELIGDAAPRFHDVFAESLELMRRCA